jgi:hypothetical protein
MTADGEGADVQVVTQVVLSLVGLLVFPFEEVIKGKSGIGALTTWRQAAGQPGPNVAAAHARPFESAC